jgi:hypothetical protein
MIRIDIQDIFSGKHVLEQIPPDATAVCASAIRTERWLNTFEYFKNTTESNFIFIFCGHKIPNFKLPKNFIFILSEEEPAACSEICLRLAKVIPEVKYIMSIADDCFFEGNIIDKLREEILQTPDRFTEVGIGHWGDINANETEPLKLLYHNHDDSSPVLSMCGMRSKETCIKIGGIDKNFKGQYWDVDRTMRLVSAGGSCKTLPNLKAREMKSSLGSHLLGPKYFKYDRPLLDSLWTIDRKGGKCSEFRMDFINEYSDEELSGICYMNIKRHRSIDDPNL